MGLIKKSDYKGIEMDYYFKIVGISFTEVNAKEPDTEGKLTDVTKNELAVKVGKYSGYNSKDLIDMTVIVFEDYKKDTNINLKMIYNRLKKHDEFTGATDVLETGQTI